MTRRTVLVPLFAAAFILAPSEISGMVTALPAPDLSALPGSSADAGRTGLFRWSTPLRAALGPQDRSA